MHFIHNIRAHVAYFLLMLFSITWLPLHVFHAHEVEVHEHALLSHDKEHSCEFDAHFCEYHDAGDCGHTAHLEPSHPGCFTCSFHFTKHIELTVQPSVLKPVEQALHYATEVVVQVRQLALYHQVRGPPAAVEFFV